MNTIQIFTFGQLDTFKAVLQALSAIFDPTNSEFFVSNGGAGAGAGALLAALLATIGLFTSYFQQAKVNGAGPFLGLLLYAALCVPKIPNVWVTDLYTGRAELVQNVPVGIGVMGYAMSTITKHMLDTFELEYSSPGIIGGDDYLSSLTNGNGFLSPLRTMMSLRQNMLKTAPYHLVHNVASYTKYCLNKKREVVNSTGPYFNVATFKSQPDPLSYFLDQNLIENVFAEVLDPVTEESSVTDCETLRTMLDTNAVGGIRFYLVNPATFGTYAYGALALANDSEPDVCKNGTCQDKASAITAADQMLSAILGSVNTNQRYMEVRLMQDINSLMGDVTDMDSQTIENIAATMSYNVELARMQEAVEGETFLHYMIPAMNALTYLFYAVFPLAMIVMVSKGAQAFTYLGGYIVFGLWVYSWMPVAVLINFSTISNVMSSLQMMQTEMPLSIETTNFYLNHAMDALATGSNLLAATPVITLIIITGSIFSLTSVASSAANPSGAASKVAQQATPAFHNNPSVAEAKSSYISTDSPGFGGAGSAHANTMLSKRGISFSETVGANVATGKNLVDASSQTTLGSISKLFDQGQTVNAGLQTNTTSSLSTNAMTAIARSTKQAYANAGVDVSGWSAETAASIGLAGFAGKPPGVAAGGHISDTDRAILSKTSSESMSTEIMQNLQTSGGMEHVKAHATAESRGNVRSKEANDALANIDSWTKLNQLQETKSSEFSKGNRLDQTQSLTGMEAFNSIDRQTNGYAGKSYGNMVDTMGRFISKSIDDHGLGSRSDGLLDKFEIATLKANQKDFGPEMNAVSGFDSGLTALSTLRTDAIKKGELAEAAMWADVASDMMMGAMGHSYAGYQMGQNTQGVGTPKVDIENSTLKEDVAGKQTGVAGQVEQGHQTVKAADKFTQDELVQSQMLGAQMNQAATSFKGQTSNYAADYFSMPALNDAAKGYLSEEGKPQDAGFDKLSDVNKRQVLADQQVAALNAFESDFGSHLDKTSLSLGERGRYENTYGGLIDAVESHVDAIGKNGHESHGDGVIGKGELNGVTKSAAGIVGYANDFIQSAQIDSDAKDVRADRSREQIVSKASVSNEGFTGNIKGKESGIDPELQGRAMEIANQAQSLVNNGVWTQDAANNWASSAMHKLFENNAEGNWFKGFFNNDEEAANAFMKVYDSVLDTNNSPGTALAMALESTGYNQTGSIQNGVLEMVSLGLVTGGGSYAAEYRANAEKMGRAEQLELDLGDKNIKSKLSATAGKVLDNIGQVAKSASRTGYGAVLGLAISGYQYEVDEETNKKISSQVSNALVQNNVMTALNTLPEGQQQSVRNQFVDNLIDKAYAGDPSTGNQFKQTLKDQNDGQNYTNNQMISLMTLSSVSSEATDNKPLVDSMQVVKSFNDVKGAPRI